MREHLPNGWTTTVFADLNSFSSRSINPAHFPNETFELYSVPIFPTGEPEILKGSEIGSSKQLVEPGDVLLCKINPRINRVWKVGAKSDKRQIASSEWITMRTQEVSQNFLQAYFRSSHFRDILCEDLTGVGGSLTRAQPKRVATFRLPIPPLAEQKRIADKLELLLGRVDTCRARLDRVPALLKRFRQSVLAAAVSGSLTAIWRNENEVTEDASSLLERMDMERRETFSMRSGNRKYREADAVADEELPEIPSTWQWTNFDHCASDITVGHVGPMKDRYTTEGTAFLRCQNVRPMGFDARGLVRIPPDFHSQLSKSKLTGGEILVVRSGANTGDCCVYPGGLGEANCSDLVITRPLSGLSPKYGVIYVNSPTGQSLLDQKQAGVAQPHFNIGAMRVKAFPLAPLPEQQEIVRRVEALFAYADRIEASLARAQKTAERLTPATLAKAFRGELAPQDPNDEPASALLERLKEAQPTPPKGKARKTATRLSSKS